MTDKAEKRLTLTEAKAIRTARRKEKFLQVFGETMRLKTAAAECGVPKDNVYSWLRADENFRQQFDDLANQIGLLAEDAAIERAIEGHDEPLSYKGELTGHSIRKYSDTLLALVLKARNPAYREKAGVEVNIANSGNVLAQFFSVPVHPTEADIADFEKHCLAMHQAQNRVAGQVIDGECEMVQEKGPKIVRC